MCRYQARADRVHHIRLRKQLDNIPCWALKVSRVPSVELSDAMSDGDVKNLVQEAMAERPSSNPQLLILFLMRMRRVIV